jgi:hypothetical protein
MRILLTAIGLSLALSATVQAQAVDGKAAGKLVFASDKAEVKLMAGVDLPKEQVNAVKSVLAVQPYYGAMAMSPDEGLMSESTVATANFHSVEAAGAAAVAQCNDKKTGASPCVVVAVVQPKGWKARALQLSAEATAGLKSGYPAMGGALAISTSTGVWGMGQTAEAALGACAETAAKPKDCTLVVEN